MVHLSRICALDVVMNAIARLFAVDPFTQTCGGLIIYSPNHIKLNSMRQRFRILNMNLRCYICELYAMLTALQNTRICVQLFFMISISPGPFVLVCCLWSVHGSLDSTANPSLGGIKLNLWISSVLPQAKVSLTTEPMAPSLANGPPIACGMVPNAPSSYVLVSLFAQSIVCNGLTVELSANHTCRREYGWLLGRG